MVAADGFVLTGSHFEAPGSDTAVIVHGATGVPHGFYSKLAQFFQATGWHAVTYDYRGIGASRPATLRGLQATMGDWGRLDIPAALHWVHETLAPRRVFFVGHSVGGQLMGLLEAPARVDAVVTVSSQSGYWRLQGGSWKWRTRLVVSAVIPLVTRLWGYFPWSWLAAGEDLPRGVALQWARWCRHPNYVLSDTALPVDRYAAFEAPILAYSIDDDDWGTRASVDAMMAAYPNVERAHLRPAEHGIAGLGHMGYFRSRSSSLWPQARDWLDRQM